MREMGRSALLSVLFFCLLTGGAPSMAAASPADAADSARTESSDTAIVPNPCASISLLAPFWLKRAVNHVCQLIMS